MSEYDQQLPSEVLSHDGVATVLPGGPAPAPRRRRLLAVGAAAVLVVAAAAGAVAVGSALGGGGAQPETVVPASAVAYVELDLDPAAGQKVDAYRFIRKFPALQDVFTADGGYGPALAQLFSGSGVDYDTQIKPWLGKRFAVALVPGPSGGPRLMFVAQATDEAKAKAAAEQLIAAHPLPGLSLTVHGGYLVAAWAMSPGLLGGAGSGDVADQLVAEADASSLAQSPAYTSAIEPYGDTVAIAWADNAGTSTMLQDLSNGLGVGAGALTAGQPTTGSSVTALRFDGDALELVGRSTGMPYSLGTGGVAAVEELPQSTLVAVGGNDLGTVLRDAYGPVWAGLGVLGGAGAAGTDPAQWPRLLGQQIAVAVGADGSEPTVGAHVVGDASTVQALQRLLARSDDDVHVSEVPDGLVIASDQPWLDALSTPGTFGESAAFRAAVPDAAAAGLVAFADVDGLLVAFGHDVSAEDRANLEPLRAVGLSVGGNGSDTTFRLRVLAD